MGSSEMIPRSKICHTEIEEVFARYGDRSIGPSHRSPRRWVISQASATENQSENRQYIIVDDDTSNLI